MNTVLLKVAANSNASSLAGALAQEIENHDRVEMQAIGAGALNQAIKAIAIARGFVAPRGIDLVCVPAFVEVQIGEETRTAIKLYVEPRR